MIEKLKATARDVALAAFAAFAGSFAIALKGFIDAGDYSVPVIRAFVVAAGTAAVYAAFRAAVGAVAAKFAK